MSKELAAAVKEIRIALGKFAGVLEQTMNPKFIEPESASYLAGASCTLRAQGKPYPRTCPVCFPGKCLSDRPEGNVSDVVSAARRMHARNALSTPYDKPWNYLSDREQARWIDLAYVALNIPPKGQ